MQQVDAACKAAEDKVIEQRKEIDSHASRIKDLINQSDALFMKRLRAKREHRTCKECATLREEIINRDAVILEQERKADRTDEVIRNALEQLKELHRCSETLKNIISGRRIIMSSEFDTPELHQGYQPRANCVRPITIGFVGKREDMPNTISKHSCKWYDVCTIASETSYACTANEGQHCGRKREIDANHGVMQ